MKYHMHGTDAQRKAESFEKIKDDIVSRVKRTFKDPLDIVTSLKELREKTFQEPDMAMSDKTGDAKVHEERMLQLKYQIDYEHWLTDQKVYKENMVKLYEVIFYTYCSKEVQMALKEQSDFESDVLNKPLELMNRIKVLVHTPEKAKYPFLTLIEVFASLLNFKQGENEDLVSYLSRFKSEKDVVENLFGKEYLHGYIKRTQEYQRLTDADEKKEKLVEGME